MFLLSECILFIFIMFCDSVWLKYLSIFLCFLYTLYRKEGIVVLWVVLLADYCLLINDYYEMGIFLFIVVQCLYHEILGSHYKFYIFLFLLLYPQMPMLVLCYILMSFTNLIVAYQKKHSLFITIVLLGLCDICVAIQYIFSIHVPLIWLFYLPSQVEFVKKDFINEDGAIVMGDSQKERSSVK